jgi:transcriptional regulator with XRE-family HTH domain
LRLDKGMSQKELAAKVGIADTRISNLERGKGNPTLSTLLLIADALGTSVRELFEHRR